MAWQDDPVVERAPTGEPLAGLTPTELRNDTLYEYTPGNLAELDREIAFQNARNPAIAASLDQYKQKLFADAPQIASATVKPPPVRAKWQSDPIVDPDIPTPTPQPELNAQAAEIANRPWTEKLAENIRQNTMMGGATDWRNMLGAAPPSASVAGITGAGEGAVGAAIRHLTGSTPSKEALTRAAGQAEGMVVPASQSGRANILGRIFESFVPKEFVSQAGTLRNQAAIKKMAAQELGLPPNTEITVPLLKGIRNEAGTVYEKVKGTGTIYADQEYLQDLVKIRDNFLAAAMDFPGAAKTSILKELRGIVPTQRDGNVRFGADAAVQMISQLRSKANEAFRAGKADEGAAYKQMALAVEGQLGRHLERKNLPWIDQYRKAREVIAKSHDIEDALNIGTSSISPGKIASAEPPSGKLRTIAEFAKAFPRVMRDPAQYGSERMFNLTDVLAGVLGNAYIGPEGALFAAARPIAKVAASRLALSGQPTPDAIRLQQTLAAIRALQGQPELEKRIQDAQSP